MVLQQFWRFVAFVLFIIYFIIEVQLFFVNILDYFMASK